MKTIDIGQIITIFANIGVIAGIVFLAYELRQNTLATEIASAQNVITNIGDRNAVIIESDEFANIVLRAEAGEQLTPSEQMRLNFLYSDGFRGWRSIFLQRERGALDNAMWHTQLAEMKLSLNNFQTFRAQWERTKAMYSPEFNELLEALVSD